MKLISQKIFFDLTNASQLRRRGLTFIELLFSVVILGIGMIIIASVFPVAVSEQKATLEAVTANSIERNAARSIDTAASVTAPVTTQWLPDTPAGQVVTLAPATGVTGGLWDRFLGDMIDKTDPHYAWTALYQRPMVGTDNDTVTLFIATLASRESAAFDASKTATYLKLVPQNVKITYTAGANPDTIKVEAVDPAHPVYPCEGAFIIRATNVDASNVPYPQNAIIKLGNDLGGGVFEVAPGFEYLGVALTANSPAFLIGRDPTTTDGANQVMSCRAVRINVPNPG